LPRPAKGPRLYFYAEWVTRDGERVQEPARWFIRDGSVTRRTGCGESDRTGAEKRLGEYLAEKFRPTVRDGDLARIPIAEVLMAYGLEHAVNTKGESPATAGYNIATLLDWWGTRKLVDVNKNNCGAYARWRTHPPKPTDGSAQRRAVKPSSPRRELAMLRAAIGHWHAAHGPLDAVPVVTLPPKAPSRERWLQRQEAALLLAGALGFYRTFWSDVATKRTCTRWERYRPGINRHLARFILIALGTGSRKGVVFSAHWMPNTIGGWIDVDRGVMHRRPAEEEETKKRRPPVRLGRRLHSHLRRWKRLDDIARADAIAKAEMRGKEPEILYLRVVTWRGRGVLAVRTAWDAAVELAGLDDKVTPHVLRHTKVTWAMQSRIDPWELSGAVGMSTQTIEDTYGHHHPDWQKNVAEV